MSKLNVNGRITRRSVLGGLGACGACATRPPTAHANEAPNVICSFSLSELRLNISNVRNASPEALRVVRMIIDTAGLQRDIAVKAADFKRSNRAFAHLHSGRRRIVYDAAYFFQSGEGQTSWRDIGVMAHEVGHHLAAHVYLSEAGNHERELEADYFAGTALSRLGATRAQALGWTSILGALGSDSHPPRHMRSKAVEAGWRHAEGMRARSEPPCEVSWLSDDLDVDGRQCRVARICGAESDQTRLACTDYDGAWRWMR